MSPFCWLGVFLLSWCDKILNQIRLRKHPLFLGTGGGLNVSSCHPKIGKQNPYWLTLNKCCFQPILVTWILVVLGDKVTKILRNSLFIFHFILPILPCKRKTSYRKSRNLSDEKPKMKLPKYVMSRAINVIYCLNWCFYREN